MKKKTYGDMTLNELYKLAKEYEERGMQITFSLYSLGSGGDREYEYVNVQIANLHATGTVYLADDVDIDKLILDQGELAVTAVRDKLVVVEKSNDLNVKKIKGLLVEAKAEEN